MSKDTNDFDFAKFLNGFRTRETKEDVTKLYIEGRINKEEYLMRMRNAS